MIISSDLIHASIKRMKRSGIDPEALDEKYGDGDRSKYATGTQRRIRLASLTSQMRDPGDVRAALERIIEGNDLLGVNYLEIGASRARSICRIHLRDANGSTVGYGTGSMVGPGVILTNHHVIGSADDARYSFAEFDYQYDINGVDKPVATFALLADPAPIGNTALDFCLVAVAPRTLDGRRSIEEFGWLPLNSAPGKSILGEYLTIIQHPGGERKQICARENKLLKYDNAGTTLWYKTDTVAGSSGSPVFNDTWQVIALHHSGVPAKDDQGRWLTIDGKVEDGPIDETRVKWIANEGIRISSIFGYLRDSRPNDALADAVLKASAAPERRVSTETPAAAAAGPVQEFRDGELRVVIPVRVTVRVGDVAVPAPRLGPIIPPAAMGGAGAAAPAGRRVLLVPAGIERVVVDQSNYDERPGYDPDFLSKRLARGRAGGRELTVPLPRPGQALEPQVLKFKLADKELTELRYWNYSVVMNKTRHLAFFSIVNVDADKRPQGAGRNGDVWYADTRISEEYQLGKDFYAKQRDLEIDRSQNPFDRGHLTRRLDAQWGDDDEISKQRGDDSFHWTNCSPQHWQFNQGKKRWAGLEDYVIDGFAGGSGRRACVINGPVFDAPLSTIGPDGRIVPKVDGKPHKDPTFGGVAIPKLFFKVVVCDREGELAAAGFLMSQEDLLATTDRVQGMPEPPEEKLTDAEAKLFQVSIVDIAKLTDLNFGAVAGAEKSVDEILEVAPRPIADLADVQLGLRRRSGC